jgi:tetratricopeptide (TPR) repeat protein
VAWSPDGQTIASVGDDGVVKLWNHNGTLIRSLPEDGKAYASSVCFSHDSQQLLVAGKRCFIQDLKKDGKAVSLTGSSSWTLCAAFSPNDSLIATGGVQGKDLFLWKPTEQDPPRRLAGKGRSVQEVAWGLDGQSVQWVVRDEEGKAVTRAFRLDDLRPASPSAKVRGPQAMSGRNEFVQAGGYSLTVRPPGQLPLYIGTTGPTRTPSWLDDDYAAVTTGHAEDDQFPLPGGSSHPAVTLLDTRYPGNYRATRLCGHEGPVLGLSGSPDGRFLATASADRTVRVWPAKLLRRFDFGEPLEPLFSLFEINGDWALWLPNGCYACNEGGRKFLGSWRQRATDELEKFQSTGESQALHECREELTAMLSLLLREGGTAEEYITHIIERDLRRTSPEERPSLRYVTFAHSWFAGQATLQHAQSNRQALSLLLNSLSWAPKISRPEPVDPAQTVFRVRLGDYRSSKGIWGPEWWDRVLNDYPYDLARPDSASAQWVAAETKCPQPYVRGDWLLSAGAKAPLYYRLLDLPRTQQGVEQLLGVDAIANLKSGKAIRSAVLPNSTQSSPSPYNRLLERHEIPVEVGPYAGWKERTERPAYWRTYDFYDDRDPRNLFLRPRGPEIGPRGFQHDGAELIFHLPNGLVGFFVADASGKRWNASTIVSCADHFHVAQEKRPSVPVTSSCITCHSSVIVHSSDVLRGHVLSDPTAYSPEDALAVLALHPPQPKLNNLEERDRTVILAAQREAWGANQRSNFGAETSFESRLSAEAAAAELSLSLTAFRDRLAGASRELLHLLGPLLQKEGTVDRDVFAAVFPRLVEEWRLGTPRRPGPSTAKPTADAEPPITPTSASGGSGLDTWIAVTAVFVALVVLGSLLTRQALTSYTVQAWGQTRRWLLLLVWALVSAGTLAALVHLAGWLDFTFLFARQRSTPVQVEGEGAQLEAPAPAAMFSLPNDATECARRGVAALEAGRYDEAVVWLSHALRLQQNESPIRVSRAIAYRNAGADRLAAADMQRALRKEPKSALDFATRAWIYNELGNHKEAVKAADDSLHLDAGCKVAMAERAHARAFLGETKLAEQDAQSAVAMSAKPDDQFHLWSSNHFWIHRAVSLYRRGTDAELETLPAASFLEPLSALYKGNAEFDKALLLRYAVDGSRAKKDKDWNRAVELYSKHHVVAQRLLLTDPESALALHDVAHALNHIGEAHRESGKLKAATEAYECEYELAQRLVQLEPKNAHYHWHQCSASLWLGELNQRLGDQQASKRWRVQCAQLAENLPRPKEASGQDPLLNLALAHECAAEVYERLDDAPAALRHLETAFAIPNGFPPPITVDAQRQHAARCQQASRLARDVVGKTTLAPSYCQRALVFRELLARDKKAEDDALRNVFLDLSDAWKGLGRLSEAIRSYEAGLAILEVRLAKSQADPWVGAYCYAEAADLYLKSTGKAEQADKAYGWAQCLLEQVAASKTWEIRFKLSVFQWVNLRRVKSLHEQFDTYTTLLQREVSRFPDDAVLKKEAVAQEFFGDYARLWDEAAALESSRKAVTLYEELAGKKNDRSANDALATSCRWAGVVHLDYGRVKEARAFFEMCLKARDEAAKEDPEAREDGAENYAALAEAYLRLGDVAEAKRLYDVYESHCERKAAAAPEKILIRRELAEVYQKVAYANLEWGDRDAAKVAVAKLLKLTQDLLGSEVRSPRALVDRANALLAAGVIQARLGDAEARELCAESIRLHEELVNAEGTCVEYRDRLADAHRTFGRVLQAAGQTDAAAEQYTRSLSVLERWAADDPVNLHPIAKLAVLQERIGRLYLERVECEKAAKWLEAARAQWKKVEESGGLTPEDRRTIALLERTLAAVADVARDVADPDFATKQPRDKATELLLFRATRLASQERHDEAVKIIEQLAALAPNEGEQQYEAARAYALCAEIVAHGWSPSRLEDTKRETWTRYADKGVTALRCAVVWGYRGLGQVLRDEMFNPLRLQPEYPKLIEAIAAAESRR